MGVLKNFFSKFSWGGSYEEYYKSVETFVVQEKSYVNNVEETLRSIPTLPLEEEESLSMADDATSENFPDEHIAEEYAQKLLEIISDILKSIELMEKARSLAIEEIRTSRKNALATIENCFVEENSRIVLREKELKSQQREIQLKLISFDEIERKIDLKVENLSKLDEQIYSYAKSIEQKELSLREEIEASMSLQKSLPDTFENVGGNDDFEKYVVAALLADGFEKVDILDKGKRFGADIIGEKAGVTYAIQCKFEKQLVGVDAVRLAASGRDYHKCNLAIVITNTVFSIQAKMLAEAMNVLLWNGAKLQKMAEV